MTRWIDQIPDEVWMKLTPRDKNNMLWIQKQIDKQQQKKSKPLLKKITDWLKTDIEIDAP